LRIERKLVALLKCLNRGNNRKYIIYIYLKKKLAVGYCEY